MIIALKEIRESKRVSVQELVDKTGLTKSQIWGYESGRRQPEPDALCALADALDITLDMLVRGKEKDRPKGRSREEILKEYDAMTIEELHRLSALLQSALAEKEFQAHIRQVNQSSQ